MVFCVCMCVIYMKVAFWLNNYGLSVLYSNVSRFSCSYDGRCGSACVAYIGHVIRVSGTTVVVLYG
jgi:hypothetical protein